MRVCAVCVREHMCVCEVREEAGGACITIIAQIPKQIRGAGVSPISESEQDR